MTIAARAGAIAALALGCAAIAVRSGAGESRPVQLAVFTEENLPAADMPATATPTASEAAAQATPGAEPTIPLPGTPVPEAGFPPAQVLPAPEAQMEPTPMPMPTDTAPLDVGSVQPRLQISDSSLAPLIAPASSPALAASLRVTEQARKDILNGRADDAIHALGRAISIDPTNFYAYFYLGRAWLEKKNYAQAMTFFKRAEIGFGSNPDWLGETLAFEGLTYEQDNKASAAMAAYQQALQVEPGNLMARVGATRLAPSWEPALTPAEPGSEPTSSQAPPPPAELPPPPPPTPGPPPPAS